jgi:amino acid adenylation domain-containing protein/FkbM family methyltransferase
MFRLSPQQKRIWALQQESAAYRAQCAVLLTGDLGAATLKAAVRAVVEHYAILRTTFQRLPGVKIPFQSIAEGDAPAWREIDLRSVAPAEQEAAVHRVFEQEKLTPFDLRQGGLRTTLVALARERHVLLLSASALCADEWTLGGLVAEISRAYAACLRGADEAGEAVQYVQFSEWQSALLEEDDAEPGRDFWRRQDLSGLDALRLPFARTPGDGEQFAPSALAVRLDPALAARVDLRAEESGCDAAVFLMACWQTLIWRLTKQPDILIGHVVDGRAYEELGGALGPFARWLPARSRFEPSLKFDDLLRQLAQATREAREWQEYFVAEQSGPAGGGAKPVSPCVAFGYEEWPANYFAGGVTFSVEREYACTEPFHLKLRCVRRAAALTAEFQYDARRYTRTDIERLAAQFETLLGSSVARPGAPVAALEIVSDEERRRLLVEWNDTARPYPRDLCVHELFERQAVGRPEAVAVVCDDRQLTYAELNRRANQLARYMQRLGVSPEARVGLCVGRSIEMVVALLAVLKAGAAYVPLDPTYPRARLGFMLADADAALLLTQRSLLDSLPEQRPRAVCLDDEWELISVESAEPPARAACAENLAYVIYTSGSTGRPKGVCVEHRQLGNYVHAILDALALPPQAHYATVSTLSADLGNTAIYPALCSGATLHVVSAERASDPALLAEYSSAHGLDVLKIVPAHLEALLTGPEAARVLPRRRLVLGGEATRWELAEQVRRLAPECTLLNHYGPTETTVGVLTHAWRGDEAERLAATLPLGMPLANTAVYVLDEEMRPVPAGVAGEIYIGGAGVSRGYWRQPALTAERFVPDALSGAAGGRLYRTGDLGRRLPHGELEFLGRADQQVKVRGFRVEPGEVEAALDSHPAVRRSAVVVKETETGGPQLVGYFVPRRRYREVIDGRRRHHLPNGMAVAHQNQNETNYLYQEIFEEHCYFRHGISLGEAPCVFDVGANIGMFTMYVSQHYPRARVFSFEPIGEVCEALRINAELYGADVKVAQCGMSDREREETFTFYPRQSMMSGASAYADAEYDKEVIKRAMRNEQRRGADGMGLLLGEADELLAHRFVARTERCRLRRLSDVIREEGVARIDLLKVDVQGAELDVLRGIEEEDWAKIGQLVMEVHDRPGRESEGRLQQISELLRARGFKVVTEQIEALAGTDRYNLFAMRAGRADGHEGARPGVTRPDALRVNSQFGPSSTELREHLRERLPEHMIPTWLVPLDELPLTPNGKLDRQALPAREHAPASTESRPRTPVEEVIAGIWAEVLKVREVSVTNNFFELGGHSLLATQVISRIRAALGVDVPLRLMFERLTVRSLAEALEERLALGRPKAALGGLDEYVSAHSGGRLNDCLVPLRESGHGAPFFCVHPASGLVHLYAELAACFPAQPFYGLQSFALSPGRPLDTSVEAMADRYLAEIGRLGTTPPYLLGGWSLGGKVAFEMARKLAAAGRPVGLLAIFDTAPESPRADAPEPTLSWEEDYIVRSGEVLGLAADELLALDRGERLRRYLAAAKAAQTIPSEVSEEQFARFLEVYAANERASRAYRPSPYPGRVVLFRSAADNGLADAYGWGQYALGGVEVVRLAATHGQFVQGANAVALANLLRPYMRAALAARAGSLPEAHNT